MNDSSKKDSAFEYYKAKFGIASKNDDNFDDDAEDDDEIDEKYESSHGKKESNSYSNNEFSIHNEVVGSQEGGFDDDFELSTSQPKVEAKKDKNVLPSQKPNKFEEERKRIDQEIQLKEKRKLEEKKKMEQTKANPLKGVTKDQPKELSIKGTANKVGTDRFKEEEEESDQYEESNEFKIKGAGKVAEESDGFEEESKEELNEDDFNAFDHYEESQESKQSSKHKFVVNSEKGKQNNVFKDQAMVKTITKQLEPAQKQSTLKAQTNKSYENQEFEIKMKVDVKEQSEIGFDDEIEDHFSEEAIEDDYSESDKGTKQQNRFSEPGSTVNMGSVIPNPKLVNSQTQQKTKAQEQSSIVQHQVVQETSMRNEEDEIDEEWGQDGEVEDKQKFTVQMNENSFEKIHKQIQQIEPQWSPKNKDSKTQPKKQSSSKARPQTAKVTRQDQSKGRANSDIKEVLKTSQKKVKQEKKKVPVEEEKKVDSVQNQSKVLLNQKPVKNTRIVMSGRTRPESAKPKVGYEGKPNVLGGKQSQIVVPALNTNDLSAQMEKSKKFQVIKQIKERKEKHKQMIVRDLTKVNILPKPKQPAKKKFEAEELVITHKAQPENDFGFDEEEADEGDQAGAPQMEEDQLEDIMIDKDELGFDEDEDEGTQKKKNGGRQSVKDLASLKTKEKQEKGFIGNALGSGQFNQMHEEITRQNVNIGLAPVKKGQKPPEQQVKREDQFQNKTIAAIPKNLQKVEDSKKEREAQQAAEEKARKEEEIKQRFNQIQKEKKEKAINKDVLGFMLQKDKINKSEKQGQLASNVNKLASNFDLKDNKGPSKPSDKVSEHAKLIIDDEGQSKLVLDLKQRLKELHFENKKIQGNVAMVEKKNRQNQNELDKVMVDKNLVTINGRLQINNHELEKNLKGFKMEDIPNFDNLVQDKVNPLEPVVKKIEDRGFTLEQIFVLLDDNGDEVLTISEVTTGLANIGVQLTQAESQELIKQIDSNNDGVLTLEEFKNTLKPRYEAQKEYKQIMQGLEVDDPLVLEERILDLKYRTRLLDSELTVLKQTVGTDLNGRNKGKDKSHMKLAEKLKGLELKMNEKVSVSIQEKLEFENKIKSNLMAKDQVHQDYYQAQRDKERLQNEYSMRLEQIQNSLHILDLQMNESTQLCLMLKNDREQMKQLLNRQKIKISSMNDMEAKLDKQLEEILGRAIDGKDLELLYELDLKTLNELNSGSNDKFNTFIKHFACVTIQRAFRGHTDRKNYSIMKFQMKRLARILQPVVRQRQANIRMSAITFIQRAYRRMKARKEQMQRLKLKNQMQKMREEEDEKYYQSDQKMKQAAKVILKYWQNYKAKKHFDMYSAVRGAKSKAFGKAETIYFPTVKKCIICKNQNAQRFCSGCNDGMFCLNCFEEYHLKGHRKTHAWKRISYTTMVEGGRESGGVSVGPHVQMLSTAYFQKKENVQPNIKDVGRGPPLQQEEKTIVEEKLKAKPARKSVRMDDSAFLKNVRDILHQKGETLRDIVMVELGEEGKENERVKLSTINQVLLKSENLGLSRDDTERLIEVMKERFVKTGAKSSDPELELIALNKMMNA